MEKLQGYELFRGDECLSVGYDLDSLVNDGLLEYNKLFENLNGFIQGLWKIEKVSEGFEQVVAEDLAGVRVEEYDYRF